MFHIKMKTDTFSMTLVIKDIKHTADFHRQNKQ